MSRSTDKTLESEAGISRIDQPAKRTHGWFARVYLGGKTFSKFFADKALGGVRPALLAARTHRAAVLAASRGEAKTGLGGLYITRMDYARAKGWWVRVSVGNGRLVTRLFSDSEFGSSEGARAAAGHWRDAVAVHHGLGAKPAGRGPKAARAAAESAAVEA